MYGGAARAGTNGATERSILPVAPWLRVTRQRAWYAPTPYAHGSTEQWATFSVTR